MKNVAIINVCDWGSTGKIAKGFVRDFNKNGYNTYFCYGRGEKPKNDHEYKIDTDIEVRWHAIRSRICGTEGNFSTSATKRLLSKLEEWKIDSIVLVNLMGYYINRELLFDFIKRKRIKSVYLMIDEAAYTGNCGGMNDCLLYREGCKKCPHYKDFPTSLFLDRSNVGYKSKERCYNGLDTCVFAGPEFVIVNAKQSPVMQGLRMEIVDEAVDVDFYTPKDASNLRSKYNISKDKIIIGCVAPYPNNRKGVQYLIDAAKLLENDDRFVFVQVGYKLEDKTFLPKNYVAVPPMYNQEELSYYYSLPDAFAFPSVGDTMPNTCLEALSAGTPLICFDISGMPYMFDTTVGTLVPPKDPLALSEAIKHVSKKTETMVDTCRKYALNRYDNKQYSNKIINILRSIK